MGSEINMNTETREGLPREAFAIVGDPENGDTWLLPHHKKSIQKAIRGKQDIEKTVDWKQMTVAVSALSPGNYRRRHIRATPETILNAARHLADHYRQAGKPLPDILAALA